MPFQGFSPETLDFLWGIRFNNNRDWFQVHKQTYLDTLYHPMLALAEQCFAPLRREPGLLCKVSRIYRDARLHSLPYKDHLWTCVRRDGMSWSEQPTLFFELTPDNYSFGFLLWGPKASFMEGFRKTLAENSAPFLQLVQQVEKKTNLTVGGNAYCRKKPCPAPELERFYQLKNITVIEERPIDELLYQPALADMVCERWQQLYPLQKYFQDLSVILAG